MYKKRLIRTDSQEDHRVNRSRLLAWFGSLSLVIAALGVSLLLYWNSASNDVLVVKNSPFPSRVISNGVDRYVVLDVDYCKSTDNKGRLRLSFEGKTVEFLPLTDEKAPKGCATASYPVRIPDNVKSGEYIIRFRVTYNINPLKQDIPVEFESTKFTI